VNDTHGHAVGDQVLAAVATVLSRAVRDDDMVARTGGDEFVVALRASPDCAAVELRASAVLDGVRSLRVDDIGALSVSVGVVRDDGTGDVDDVVRRADEALFRAKDAGRDRYSW
jgi:diguanylate cyclase (GGDEF)-like protein